MKTKLCRHCGKILQITNFSKQTGNPDGYQAWCKSCVKEYINTKDYSHNKYRTYDDIYTRRPRNEHRHKIRSKSRYLLVSDKVHDGGSSRCEYYGCVKEYQEMHHYAGYDHEDAAYHITLLCKEHHKLVESNPEEMKNVYIRDSKRCKDEQ